MGKVPFLSGRCRSLATLVSDSLTAKLTNWLTHSFLVDLTEVTLAFEDANSKLLDVVSVADFDTKECVDERLVYISKLMFDRDFEPKCQEKILSVMFCQDFEARFWSWIFVKILKLKFCRDFETEFRSRFRIPEFEAEVLKFWLRQKWSTIFFQLDFQNPIYLHSKTAFRNLFQRSHTHTGSPRWQLKQSLVITSIMRMITSWHLVGYTQVVIIWSPAVCDHLLTDHQ